MTTIHPAFASLSPEVQRYLHRHDIDPSTCQIEEIELHPLPDQVLAGGSLTGGTEPAACLTALKAVIGSLIPGDTAEATYG